MLVVVALVLLPIIVAEQFDVECSIGAALATNASECEPISVEVFSDDDF